MTEESAAGRACAKLAAMGFVLVGCGLTALAIGGWRGYALAREAVGPLAHVGDPTRTAIEAARPVHARYRVRSFVRRVAASVGWLVVALYGLYLVQAGTVGS
jgi:hypothetical protein